MSAERSFVVVVDRLRELERELFSAYERLGIHRTPLPPVDTSDPNSVEAHVQWIEKELRGLDRLLLRPQQKKRSTAAHLADFSPVRLSNRLARLGLSDPESITDAHGGDPGTYQRLRPVARRLFEDYWRVEADGVHHVPTSGPALLVPNHAGIIPFDALMVHYALAELHPAGRMPRFLIEDWFMRMPIMGLLLTRLGALRGSPDNAERLIREGHVVGMFPEGAKGISKLYRDRYRVQRFGRGGVIRLAIQHRVPIVPTAIVGSEEIYPVVARVAGGRVGGDFDALPVPLQAIFGPLALIPLPSKWMIRFGEPMNLGDFPPATADDDIVVNTLNEELRQRVQELVNALLQRRRSPWLG